MKKIQNLKCSICNGEFIRSSRFVVECNSCINKNIYRQRNNLVSILVKLEEVIGELKNKVPIPFCAALQTAGDLIESKISDLSRLCEHSYGSKDKD